MQMSPGEMMASQQPQAGGLPQGGPAPEQAGATPEESPVLDAFRTIAEYVAALSEMGDPSAPELQNLMSQFVSVLQKKVGQESGMAPPQQQQQPPTAPSPLNRAQAPGGGGGVNPMLGGMTSGTKAMRGQVAVI